MTGLRPMASPSHAPGNIPRQIVTATMDWMAPGDRYKSIGQCISCTLEWSVKSGKEVPKMTSLTARIQTYQIYARHFQDLRL